MAYRLCGRGKRYAHPSMSDETSDQRRRYEDERVEKRARYGRAHRLQKERHA
jgi:hypothetical protein